MDSNGKDLPVEHHLLIVARELLQSGAAVWHGSKPGLTPAGQLKRKTVKSLGEMAVEDRR